MLVLASIMTSSSVRSSVASRRMKYLRLAIKVLTITTSVLKLLSPKGRTTISRLDGDLHEKDEEENSTSKKET